MGNVTKSQQNNITSPNGNSLAVFVEGVSGVMKVKDVMGNIQPLSDFVGSSGSSIYDGDSPTTITVENIPSGTDITGYTYDALFENIYAPYVAPTFNSFSISQSNPIEVGAVISGLKSFSWSFITPTNVSANSVSVLDVTSNTTLQSGISNSSPQNVNIGSVQKTTATYNQWKANAIDTKGNVLQSDLATVYWFWKVYYGISANTTLNESQIESLTGLLAQNQFADYSFSASNYKYICYPDSFGSPTASTGFKDTSTNLVVSMADSSDNAFYSNTENGWSYGLVNVTNAQGIATNYRVYRTKNILGGTITIRVS